MTTAAVRAQDRGKKININLKAPLTKSFPIGLFVRLQLSGQSAVAGAASPAAASPSALTAAALPAGAVLPATALSQPAAVAGLGAGPSKGAVTL